MMKKVLSAFAIAFLSVACTQTARVSRVTVKITNLAGNSGGSGVILNSSPTKSQVLTNGHICDVIRNGGVIHTYDHNIHFVTSYKKSTLHDLCLISTSSDLYLHTSLSPAPPPRGLKVEVSGHPHLMPNIITYGDISDKNLISVLVGARPCTDEEIANPQTGLFCSLVGKLPIIRTYEAILTSALIQPGSSGSAVFDIRTKEIVGVVFAGASDLSFGYLVPWEYVYNFTKIEALILPETEVNAMTGPADESAQNVQVIEKACEKPELSQNIVCNMLYHRSH